MDQGCVPVVWGVGQIVTGPHADKIGRKPLIVWGRVAQAIGHLVIGIGQFPALVCGLSGSVLLGIGTAMVYSALLAALSDASPPEWRAWASTVFGGTSATQLGR